MLLRFYMSSGEDSISAFKGKVTSVPLKKVQTHNNYHITRLSNKLMMVDVETLICFM